jgi:hypothetical protein
MSASVTKVLSIGAQRTPKLRLVKGSADQPASSVATETVATKPAPRSSESARRHRDNLLYALLTALVLGAWAFTRLGLYTTKSNTAYWLGIVGGVSMLLLLTYPIRKHFRFTQHWGSGAYWFIAHMVLGIAGPILILLHSNFEIGSLNAGVAFYAMVTVALSGVIGRFLYVRVHSNLNGVKLSLGQLRELMDVENASAAKLRFAPAVMQRCHEFESWTRAQAKYTITGMPRSMLVLPWMRWRAERQCRRLLRSRLVVIAHTEGWSRRRFNSRLIKARKLVREYLATAQRVAQFTVWERLFSWWHVAHVPFVYMLVASAIAHVIAVHAY